MSSSESDSDFDLNFISNAVKNTTDRIKKVKSNLKIPLSDIGDVVCHQKTDARQSKASTPSKKSPVPEVVLDKQDKGKKKEVSITPPASPTTLRKDSEERIKNRSKKTQKALIEISSTIIRNEQIPVAQIPTHSNDQGQDCIQIIDQNDLNSSLESIEIVNCDKNIEVELKIRWKLAIHRVKLKTLDRFGLLFHKFTEQVKEPPGSLVFRLKDKILYANDTYQSLKLNIVDIIDASYIGMDMQASYHEDLVDIKIQSIETNSRNASKTIKIRKYDPMENLMNIYAEKIKVNASDLIFKFEGSSIKPTDTPDSLDLESGDCIDVYGIKIKETEKEKKRPKRKNSKRDKQKEIIKPMIVIDDTMFN